MNAGQTGASKVVGYKWLLLSSADGDEEAKQLLERERPGMTADELSEAERLAGQFKPNPTATTESVTRRCRPDSAEASKKKSD